MQEKLFVENDKFLDFIRGIPVEEFFTEGTISLPRIEKAIRDCFKERKASEDTSENDIKSSPESMLSKITFNDVKRG